MSRTPKASGEAASEAAKEVGQRYTDLVRYMGNGNKGQQWMFTPDVIEGGLDKVAMEDKILERVKELILSHQDALAAEFGKDLIRNSADKLDWEQNVLPNLFNALDGNNSNGEKIVKIYDFSNISG